MQNKSRGRTDVHWIISSVSLALTLGLWGLFASHEKHGAGVAGQVALVPPNEQQTIVSQPSSLLPGQVLLFGGTAPQPQQQQTVITRTRTRHNGGGGSGPAASTGSSKP